MGMCYENKTLAGCMEYEVEGARPRGRPKKLGERLWKKTARHVN